jgi:hypothetical protein
MGGSDVMGPRPCTVAPQAASGRRKGIYELVVGAASKTWNSYAQPPRMGFITLSGACRPPGGKRPYRIGRSTPPDPVRPFA